MNELSTSVRILVVDNDRRTLSDLKRQFERMGSLVKVVDIESGNILADAVETARAFRPHVVILDHRLLDDRRSDDQSGLELIWKLKSAAIIYYSSYLSVPLTRTLTRNYGITHWAEKDGSPQDLVNEVIVAAGEKSVTQNNFQIKYPAGWDNQTILDYIFKDLPVKSPDMVDDVLYQLFSPSRSQKMAYDTLYQSSPPPRQKLGLECLENTNTSSYTSSQDRSVIFKSYIDGSEKPIIVKLAPSIRITRESENYWKYIQNKLGGLFYPVVEMKPVYFWELGGIAYSFIGNDNQAEQKISTFSNYYRSKKTGKEIIQPLHHFFNTLWKGYYAENLTKIFNTSIFEAYEPFLNLSDQLEINTCQSPDLSCYGVMQDKLMNPIQWLHKNKDNCPIENVYKVVTHGNLSGDDLFVDGEHSWIIDFDRCGEGPRLQDFISLEVDILTRLTEFPSDDIKTIFDLFDYLTDFISAGKIQSYSPYPEKILKSKSATKAVLTVLNIRKIAYNLTSFPYMSEYYWGLLVYLIHKILYLSDKSSQQYFSTWLYASVIATKLDTQKVAKHDLFPQDKKNWRELRDRFSLEVLKKQLKREIVNSNNILKNTSQLEEVENELLLCDL